MFKLGVGEAEGKAFVNRFQAFQNMDEETLAAIPEATMNSLASHWGEDIEDNNSTAKAVVAAMGSEFLDFLDTTGLSNDHATIMSLFRIGQEHAF